MNGYVKGALQKIGHKIPIKPQHQLYPDPEHTYGADAHKMKPLDTSPALSKERVKIIECTIGKFLCYARGVYNMCLVSLIKMSTRNYPTEQYEKNLHQLLYYTATNPNSVVIFHASDMILRADTDAAYLNKPKARSFAVGYIY